MRTLENARGIDCRGKFRSLPEALQFAATESLEGRPYYRWGFKLHIFLQGGLWCVRWYDR